MSRESIKRLMLELKKISDCYVAIKEQKEIYDSIILELRKLYLYDSMLFSLDDINYINSIKSNIDRFGECINLTEKELIDIDILKLSKGTAVFHKKEYYVGVIDGTTTIKECFEDKSNDKEYRIIDTKRKIKVASPYNLKQLGINYASHCYRCRTTVHIFNKKCNSCSWYICPRCGACGCKFKHY